MLVAPADRQRGRHRREHRPARSPTRSPTGCATSALLLVLDNFEQVVAAGADRRRPAARRPGHQGRRDEPGGPPRLGRAGVPGPGPADAAGPEPAERARAAPAGGEHAPDRPRSRSGQYAAVRLFIERAVAVRPGLRASRTRTPRRSPRSAPGSTACRSPSSSPRRGSSSCRPTRSWSGSTTSSTSWRPARATCPSASRRCAARSPGATTCSTPAARRLLDRLSVFATGCELDVGRGDLRPVVRDRRRHPRRPDGARRPEPASRSRRWPTASRASGCSTRSGSTPPSSSRRAARPTASGRAIATGTSRSSSSAAAELSGRRPAALARPARASSTTTSAPSSTARSRRPTRRSRSASPSACGASGRSTATSPRRAGGSRRWRPRRGRTTIRACGRSSSRRSAATCWWQGDLAAMTACYREALDDLARRIGDERRDRQRLLQRVVHVRRSRTCRVGRSGPGSRTGPACATSRRARDIYHRIGDRRGEANALWGLGNYQYFRGLPRQRRRARSARRSRCSARSATGRWRPGRCTCSGPRCCATATSTRRTSNIAARDPPLPRRRATRPA